MKVAQNRAVPPGFADMGSIARDLRAGIMADYAHSLPPAADRRW
jgi:hypothetical protein